MMLGIVLISTSCKKENPPVDADKSVMTIVINNQAEMPSKMIGSLKYFNDPEVSKIIYDIKPGKIVLGGGANKAPGTGSKMAVFAAADADSMYIAMKAIVDASNNDAAAKFAAIYGEIEVAGPARIPAGFYVKSANSIGVNKAPKGARKKAGEAEGPSNVPVITILPNGYLYLEGKIYTSEDIIVQSLIDAANAAMKTRGNAAAKDDAYYPVVAEEIVLNDGDADFFQYAGTDHPGSAYIAPRDTNIWNN
jgi:hypothetical protein